MDWQLLDIGKTITNNILLSNLSAYVSGDTVILSMGDFILLIGGSWLCISLCECPSDSRSCPTNFGDDRQKIRFRLSQCPMKFSSEKYKL